MNYDLFRQRWHFRSWQVMSLISGSKPGRDLSSLMDQMKYFIPIKEKEKEHNWHEQEQFGH
jgi:hypothetical protein